MQRATEDGAKKVLDRIGALRQRLAKLERLHALKDRAEWKDLRDLLVDLKKMHEISVKSLSEDMAELSDEMGRLRLSRHQGLRDGFDATLTLVERPQEETDRLRNTISDLEKELADKREELETFK